MPASTGQPRSAIMMTGRNGIRPVGTMRAAIRLLGRRMQSALPHRHCLACRALAVAAALSVPLVAVLVDPYFVDHHPIPDAFASFEAAINPFGRSVWYLVPLALFVLAPLFFAWNRMAAATLACWAARVQLAWFFFIVIGFTEITSSLAKQAIGRARPELAATFGPYGFDPWTFTYGFASFPSGHAATFGALFGCLASLFPRQWPLIATAAFWCGFSRAIVGAHWPSDIVAGLAFGALVAAWVALAMARFRLFFRIGPDGRPAPDVGMKMLRM